MTQDPPHFTHDPLQFSLYSKQPTPKRFFEFKQTTCFLLCDNVGETLGPRVFLPSVPWWPLERRFLFPELCSVLMFLMCPTLHRRLQEDKYSFNFSLIYHFVFNVYYDYANTQILQFFAIQRRRKLREQFQLFLNILKADCKPQFYQLGSIT